MQEKYPRCMQNITDIYPRYAWYLLIICLGYTCNIPKIYPKYTQDIYMKYDRNIWEICMRCTPDIPEISMRYTWDKHGKYLWSGCHNLLYFLSTQNGNMKFPVIMRYYCEDIMSIFLVWKKNKAYRACLQRIINQKKRNQSKEIYIRYTWFLS